MSGPLSKLSIAFQSTVIKDKMPDISTQRRMLSIAGRFLGIILGATSRVPYYNVDSNNPSTYCYIALYGSFHAWAMNKLAIKLLKAYTEEELEVLKSSTNHKHRPIILSISCPVAVLTKLPQAYISYVFSEGNQKLFMASWIVLTNSAEPAISLSDALEELQEKRKFSTLEKQLFDTRKEIIRRVKSCDFFNESKRDLILDIVTQIENSSSSLDAYELLFNKFPKFEENHSKARHVLETLSQSAGFIISLSRLALHGVTSYYAGKIITDNDLASYSIATVIVGVEAYLNSTVITRSAKNVYRLVSGLFSKDCMSSHRSFQFNNKVATCEWLLSLIMVGMSYNTPIKICEKFFEGNIKLLMQATYTSSVMLLLLNSLIENIDDITESGYEMLGPEKIKKLIKFKNRLYRYTDNLLPKLKRWNSK